MDFMDKIRGFLGFNHRPPYDNRTFDQNIPPAQDNQPRTFVFSFGNSTSDPRNSEERPRNDFDIFTNPAHMQQFFEQQMSDMFKSFGFPGFDNFFGSFDFSNSPPMIEGGYSEPEANPGDLREHFLKKGYELPARNNQVDKDVDGQVKIEELDQMLDKNSATMPYIKSQPETFFFGQSSSTSTTTGPDGSIQIRKTIRDNQGNEETTITKKLGDKEYTMIKKRDNTGKEEITENFVNITESEKDKFMSNSQSQIYTPQMRIDGYDSNLFDKLFKW